MELEFTGQIKNDFFRNRFLPEYIGGYPPPHKIVTLNRLLCPHVLFS